jgi:predicted SAM-dependent methyltransferase
MEIHAEKLPFLNLGCGNQYIPDWINIDFLERPPHVLGYDLSKGIPLEANTCDVVYHSHLLEHFSKNDGLNFLKECYRVSKPNGVLRIVVPDLYVLAKNYIKAYEQVNNENTEINMANYEWAVIELIDQMTRTKSGGEMAKYWMQHEIKNEKLLEERLGFEYIEWRERFLLNANHQRQNRELPKPSRTILHAIFMKCKKFLQKNSDCYKITTTPVLFDDSGEKHKWMYDEVGIKIALGNCGFIDIAASTAFESKIPNWENFMQLDVKQGKIRKPDSIFIEARKP